MNLYKFLVSINFRWRDFQFLINLHECRHSSFVTITIYILFTNSIESIRITKTIITCMSMKRAWICISIRFLRSKFSNSSLKTLQLSLDTFDNSLRKCFWHNSTFYCEVNFDRKQCFDSMRSQYCQDLNLNSTWIQLKHLEFN